MDRKGIRLFQLKIAGLVLAVSSLAFAANVLSFRPGLLPSSELSEGAVAMASGGRGPASVPRSLGEVGASGPARLGEKVKMDTLAMSCWDEGSEKSLNTSARFVRFTGRGCGDRLKVETWQVRNTSNGFSATVFSGSARQLTTDYIPLQVGLNEIRFVALSPEGVRHESVMRVERK